MRLASPVHLTARPRAETSAWEIGLRYGAATLVTLLAIAGAQLDVRNDFIVLLTVLTLLGVPVSLFLRLNDMKIGGVQVPRAAWNALTVIATFFAASYFVFWSLRDWFSPLLNGQSQLFWLRFGGSDMVILLMQVFLLFAALRSFALISDKDATLATVPSFSVLLLLIPVHKGIEVVVYFLAWTIVATFLFALDHRSEVRTGASATVPSLTAGQDVRLAARSLGLILGLSLISALGISWFLASRDADQRSEAETAITSLVTRLTNLALSLPETAVNSGPERQIDFSTSPGPTTRAPLWQVQAWTYDRRPVRPEYWRLFALDVYNGATWSQSPGAARRVRLDELDLKRWPNRLQMPRPGDNAFNAGNPTFNSRQFSGRNRRGGRNSSANNPIPGFNIEKATPRARQQFGPASAVVRQNITAMLPNLGFLPVVPSVRAIVLLESDQKEIRVSAESGFDVGVIAPGQTARIASDVPSLPEYGITRRAIPVRISPAAIAQSGISLSKTERARALKLPARLPSRLRDLSAEMLRGLPADANNLRRAQRIALAIQKDATYTLRPPAIPAQRDAADFFLFEGGKRGYCTYFAGALTVLCRTQNIPARVVSGFANTEWTPSGVGILREANAHAWTEIWIEGWGWAVVDATPSADRGDNAPTWIENWADLLVSEISNAALWIRSRAVPVGVLAALGILALLFRWHKRRFFAPGGGRVRYDEDGERRAVIDIYRRLSRHIARRFRPRAPWETPDEWVQPYAATLAPADAESLRRITALYLHARYGARPLPGGSASLARETAARIGWKKVAK